MSSINLQKARVFGVLAVLVGTLMAVPVTAAVPATVLVEGALLSKGGGPAADGEYEVTFSLYEAQSGGAAVWSEATKITVKSGAFRHALGSVKALDDKAVGALKATWLGATVKGEPEMPRASLHAALYSRFAANAGHAATADAAKTADNAKTADSAKVADSAKTADTAKSADKAKSADTAAVALLAKNAQALNCSGCVAVAALKFDADIDLKDKGLVAAKLTAKTIVAAEYIGDGSKLTGIKIPSGKCAKAGYVVNGINPDGSLSCVVGNDGSNLPKDGIKHVTNGVMANQFVDKVSATGMPIEIPDNNPDGIVSTIDFPDFGTAESFTVRVHVTNSKREKVRLLLYDPAAGVPPKDLGQKGIDKKAPYVLSIGTLTGTGAINLAWPPAKTSKGDLGKVVGTNPKGKWSLVVIDDEFKDNKKDGALVAWSLEMQTLSNSKVQVKGDLVFNEGGALFPAARVARASSDALAHSKSLTLKTGSKTPSLLAQAWFYDNNAKSWVQANAGSVSASGCTACGTGSDGDYKPAGNTTLSTSKVWNFKDFIIPKGVTVTATGTAALQVKATGKIQIDGALILKGGNGSNITSTNGSNGCYGGQSQPGKGGPGGYDGGYGVYSQHSTGFYDGKGPGSGKKGAYNWSGGCGSGGGGGGHGTGGSAGVGSGGAGGGTYNTINTGKLEGGSGGGAGGYGSATNATGAGAGGGGGAVLLVGGDVVITGTVNANGGDGGRNFSSCDGGASGGGAGGAIWIRGGKVSIQGGASVTALGGKGGTGQGNGGGNECGGNGGNGGNGRIRVDSSGALTGTTSPSYQKGDGAGLAPPVQNKFRIDQPVAGQVVLTNETGQTQKVHLVVAY